MSSTGTLLQKCGARRSERSATPAEASRSKYHPLSANTSTPASSRIRCCLLLSTRFEPPLSGWWGLSSTCWRVRRVDSSTYSRHRQLQPNSRVVPEEVQDGCRQDPAGQRGRRGLQCGRLGSLQSSAQLRCCL